VCRDFAHLVVALLRAVKVPARLVSVYAPGLSPMDFHAVAEAFVEGQWRVVDATLLAPRQSRVRITTGRDAADTAFLDNHKGGITLNDIAVTAVVDGNHLRIQSTNWCQSAKGPRGREQPQVSSYVDRGEPSGWVRFAVRPVSRRSRPRSSSAAPS